MKKRLAGRFIAALMALFLGVLLLEYDLRQSAAGIENNTVAEVGVDSPVIDSDTPVVFQQVYLKSRDIVTGLLPEQQTLIGKTVEEINRFYPAERGYNVRYADKALTIRQRIDDYSPQDKQKYRLKAYQGLVAIYQGATTEEDVLQRVTSIRCAILPPDVQEKLAAGAYEFEDVNQMNDVLMNFDEWAE